MTIRELDNALRDVLSQGPLNFERICTGLHIAHRSDLTAYDVRAALNIGVRNGAYRKYFDGTYSVARNGGGR